MNLELINNQTHILNDMNLISAKVISEGSGYIDAQQALAALLIQKGRRTQKIQVTKDYRNAPGQITLIQIQDIINVLIYTLNRACKRRNILI